MTAGYISPYMLDLSIAILYQTWNFGPGSTRKNISAPEIIEDYN